MIARYAIYAAPRPEEPLWVFGSAMLGYDAASGADLPLHPPNGFDVAAWRELTADPRRYGFHGTLKPPFELAEGRSEAELRAALDEEARTLTSVAVERLTVTTIGRFIALTPDRPTPALERLAGEAVERFDRFRAPLTAADRARRNPDKLSERQRDYLDRWGYPYVFEEFRYHMTLTGRVPPDELGGAKAALVKAHAAAVPEPGFLLDALVLFKQSRRDERFRVLSRHLLRA